MKGLLVKESIAKPLCVSIGSYFTMLCQLCYRPRETNRELNLR